MFSNKDTNRSNGDKLLVPSIDFCDYLLTTIAAKSHDLVAVKLDIEGTEFAVLDDVFKHDSCSSVIDSMGVEFHHRFFNKQYIMEHNIRSTKYYINEMTRKNITYVSWG